MTFHPYGYSFIKDARKEFGAGLGLHYLDMLIFIQGDAYLTIEGTDNSREWVANAERGINDWAILPNIGVYGNYAFSPKWLGIAHIDWISANINQYDGTMWNANVGVNFQAFKHVGFDLAYQYFNIDLSVEDGDWIGSAEMRYSGPIISVTANW